MFRLMKAIFRLTNTVQVRRRKYNWTEYWPKYGGENITIKIHQKIKVHLLVANTIIQRIVGNCIKTVKAINRQYWNFIRITFLPSVYKKHDKICKE